MAGYGTTRTAFGTASNLSAIAGRGDGIAKGRQIAFMPAFDPGCAKTPMRRSRMGILFFGARRSSGGLASPYFPFAI
jgi:hypothetical protein